MPRRNRYKKVDRSTEFSLSLRGPKVLQEAMDAILSPHGNKQETVLDLIRLFTGEELEKVNCNTVARVNKNCALAWKASAEKEIEQL